MTRENGRGFLRVIDVLKSDGFRPSREPRGVPEEMPDLHPLFTGAAIPASTSSQEH